MMFVENSGGFEVRRCSFFVGKVGSVRSTPVRRVLPVAGASSGAGFSAAGNLLPSCRVRRQAAHASRAGFSGR